MSLCSRIKINLDPRITAAWRAWSVHCFTCGWVLRGKQAAWGGIFVCYILPDLAWRPRRCKRNEVPMEKVFNKSLLNKFAWAMDVEPEFRF